jgi:hypothetical protein
VYLQLLHIPPRQLHAVLLWRALHTLQEWLALCHLDVVLANVHHQ